MELLVPMRGHRRLAAALLCLLGLQAAGAQAQRLLRIDLLDPDADFSDLPQVTQGEIDALRDIAGPGPGGLDGRLRSTGIALPRLRAWIPYLCLGEDPERGEGAFTQRISIRGSGRAAVRTRLRWSEGAITATGVVAGSASGPASADAPLTGNGLVDLRMSRGAIVSAGTFTAGISGPDPWEDPMRPNVLGRGDGESLLWRSAAGARGAGLACGSGAAAVWEDPSLGRGGIALARPTSRISACAGAAGKRGWGCSVTARSEQRSASLAVHAPRSLRPSVRLMATGASGWYLHAVRSMGHRPDGRDTRCEFGLSGAGRGLHAMLRVSVGGDSARPGSRSVLHAVLVSRSVRLEGTIRGNDDRLRVRCGCRYRSRLLGVLRPSIDAVRERRAGFASTTLEPELAWERAGLDLVVSASGPSRGPLSPARIRAIGETRRAAVVLGVSWNEESHEPLWTLEMRCRTAPRRRR